MEFPSGPADIFLWSSAGLGLPVAVWILRRRGDARGPVPRCAPPDDRQGLLGAAAAVGAWLLGMVALQGAGLRPQSGIATLIAASAAVNLVAVMAGYTVQFWMAARGEAGGSGPAVEDRDAAPRRRVVLAGVLAALAFLPVSLLLHTGTMWLQERLGWAPRSQGLIEKAASGDPQAFLAVLLFAVSVAPVLEEAFFRGLLQTGMRRHLGPLVAGVLSALVFGLVHFEPGSAEAGLDPNIAPVVPLVAMGLVLAWLRERTGGLLAPITMHCVYNAVQMVAVRLQAGDAL